MTDLVLIGDDPLTSTAQLYGEGGREREVAVEAGAVGESRPAFTP